MRSRAAAMFLTAIAGLACSLSCGGADGPPCTTSLDCAGGYLCVERVCVIDDAGLRPFDGGVRVLPDGRVIGGADAGRGGGDGGVIVLPDGRVIPRGDGGGTGSDGGVTVLPDGRVIGGDDGGPRVDGGFSADCGAYGQACCAVIEPCRNGGCVDGVCAAFGGAYQRNVDSGACVTGNPMAAGACDCGPGFLDQRVYDADAAIVGGAGQSYELYVCAPRIAAASQDFHGGFGRRLAIPGGCTEGIQPNRLTADASCPVSSAVRTYRGVHHLASSGADCLRELSLCEGPGARHTYGGSYRLIRSLAPGCREEDLLPEELCPESNRFTGMCDCPFGFVATEYPMMIPNPRFPPTDPNRFCAGVLGICSPAP